MDDRPTTTAAEAGVSDSSEDAFSTAHARDQASGTGANAESATALDSVVVDVEQREEQVSSVVPSHAPHEPAAQHAVRKLEQSMADLRAALREELRMTLEQQQSTGAASDAVVESVFDASAVTDRIDEIERMMTELLSAPSPESTVPDTTMPDAAPPETAPISDFASAEPIPEPPPATSTLDEAIATVAEVEAPPEPAPAPEPQPEAAVPPADEPAPIPAPEAAVEAAPVQHVAAAVTPEPAPAPEAKPAAKPRRSLREFAEGLVLTPLRAISAPMAMVPASVRPMVSAFALTLPIWIPAFWWLSQQVAAAERVRPLDVTELTALTEALHPVESAGKSEKEGHGGKSAEKAAGGHEPKSEKAEGGHEGGKSAAKSGGHEAEAKKAPAKKEASKAKPKGEHAGGGH